MAIFHYFEFEKVVDGKTIIGRIIRYKDGTCEVHISAPIKNYPRIIMRETEYPGFQFYGPPVYKVNAQHYDKRGKKGWAKSWRAATKKLRNMLREIKKEKQCTR